MQEYQPPIQDMRFVLDHLVDMAALAQLPGLDGFGADLARVVLDEAGRFASGVLSPLNRRGDLDGARCKDGEVVTTPGWIDAYRAFVDGGWNGLAGSTDFGGQGLPMVLATLTEEMWNSANMAFALCPLLTRGAAEAVLLRGSDELKRVYLEKLITGQWAGAMNLTESQAGSDLSMIRSQARPQPDGSYRISGQKIFITYGEHDLTENIVHLVLARTPGAPAGVKGISLFLVPKFLVNADGILGARNDLLCTSIEHKLGIHGSPTCTMQFGTDSTESGGAIGWRIGDENRGLEIMFIMMNAARFGVALQGLGIAERAYQRAAAYASERIQGERSGPGGGKVSIAHHPDVRRMMLTMRSRTEAMRALAVVVAEAMDLAHLHPDAAVRDERQAFVDLMIPVVKGWFTESSTEIASIAIQVHGGMGFVEESGAAQHLRDARITAIYEGTTGIQANDLVGRKIARDGAKAAKILLLQMRATLASVGVDDGADLLAIKRHFEESMLCLEEGVDYVVSNFKQSQDIVLAGAAPLLDLFGIVCGGWQLLRSAVAARALSNAEVGTAYCRSKIAVARFYAEHVLPGSSALLAGVVSGGSVFIDVEEAA
ncbi:MAG: Acyl-CoA dehydrogenase [Hydrocarboniphaga sp.]|uniref:acyl-CoA dehydrogenase n=1 Tax=Hydrocarboniphaga sp. TaxID=2033016 RepID=UPI00260ACA74|nr:acyl-CoA dehydrogenase [Hydrocarboniphaga sp.]MDB5971156.1 Acyl-CoA dehydrogenase [Hydrocarboniphaga sp.]